MKTGTITINAKILQSYKKVNFNKVQTDKRLFTLNDKFRHDIRKNVDHNNREL